MLTENRVTLISVDNAPAIQGLSFRLFEGDPGFPENDRGDRCFKRSGPDRTG